MIATFDELSTSPYVKILFQISDNIRRVSKKATLRGLRALIENSKQWWSMVWHNWDWWLFQFLNVNATLLCLKSYRLVELTGIISGVRFCGRKWRTDLGAFKYVIRLRGVGLPKKYNIVGREVEAMCNLTPSRYHIDLQVIYTICKDICKVFFE